MQIEKFLFRNILGIFSALFFSIENKFGCLVDAKAISMFLYVGVVSALIYVEKDRS